MAMELHAAAAELPTAAVTREYRDGRARALARRREDSSRRRPVGNVAAYIPGSTLAASVTPMPRVGSAAVHACSESALLVLAAAQRLHVCSL